ncbi:MAG: crossover junction endodeoxyribonuclease RuvC, partial [Bacteroidales bacterium]|nr:crossover junction endodeoxyribonuclease RuvC [Bacteroidales bacterium]
MPGKERIILGIDPGTRIMGYGIIKAEGQKFSFVDMGV